MQEGMHMKDLYCRSWSIGLGHIQLTVINVYVLVPFLQYPVVNVYVLVPFLLSQVTNVYVC